MAAAAVLLLGFGAWRLTQPRHSPLAIEQEPLPPGSATKPPPPPRAAEPEPERRPAVPTLPEGKPRPLPSHSTPASEPAAPVPSGSADARSTLANENQLFKDAAEATRAGDTDAAVSYLDRLLEKYPASPLAQTALVRKLRLLAKAGRAGEAERAAKRYLELYPSGFAAAEAQQLIDRAATAPEGP
jgi:tetratricopeptide (TPR) repeat protein